MEPKTSISDEAIVPTRLSGPVLLVGEPDDPIASRFGTAFRSHGWTCLTVRHERAVWVAKVKRAALVTVVGSDSAAISLVGQLREAVDAPVVIIGSLTNEATADALRNGADGILEPDLNGRDIILHLNPVLQRAGDVWGPAVRYLRAGNLQVDLASRSCTLDGRPVALTPTEYALLTYLMSRPLQALHWQSIGRAVWKWDHSESRNTLRIHIRRLRLKLGDTSREPAFIESVYGLGYRFRKPVLQQGTMDSISRGDSSEAAVAALGHVTAMHDAVAAITNATSIPDAASAMIASMVDNGFCDASAVHHYTGKDLALVAQQGLSDAWRNTVDDPLPLDQTFLAAASVLGSETYQYADIGRSFPRFNNTRRALLSGGYHSCIFLPLYRGNTVWGAVGFAGKTRRGFEPAVTTSLNTVAQVFGLSLERWPDGVA